MGFFESSQTKHDCWSVYLVNNYRFDRFSLKHVLDGRRYSAFGVRAGQRPAAGAQLFRRIPHNKRMAGKGKHFNIVIVIAGCSKGPAPERWANYRPINREPR